ncbi:MAG: VCBS repeat-containing protein [candidate division WOR-3 bacterium]
MNNLFLFLSFVINLSPFFAFLKWEKKKRINEQEIKKKLITQLVSQKDWKIFSKMEDIVYQKDGEDFLYGFIKNKVYQIKKKKVVNLYFPIKKLGLLKEKKGIYPLLIGEKELVLLNQNLDILYYKEFGEKIEKYILEDRNFDGEDELYLLFKDRIFYFSSEKEEVWELDNNWLTSNWLVSDGNSLFLLFPDSIIILNKKLETKKIYPKKNEKFILLILKKDGLGILSKIKNRSIIAYDKNKKIEIFGNFNKIEGKIFKDGVLIKADDNLFFINHSFSYWENISEYYGIKEIKDYKIFDLNGDGREDLIVGDGNYLFYFLNNSLMLEESQRSYYQKLTNRIKMGNLYDYQDLLITLLNISAQLGLPFLEIEKKIEKAVKKYYVAKIQQQLLLSSFLSVFFVLLFVIVVRPFFLKIRSKKWRLENRSLSQIIKIAEDLIALNHNYLMKGNLLGGQFHIKKISEEFKLVEEEILYLKETLEPKFFLENYLALLKKLLNNKNVSDLIILLKEINKSLDKKMAFQRINPFELEDYLSKEGYYLLQICDPFGDEDNYKIFLDKKIENFLTHLLVDHLKYAKKWATVVLEKRIITEWQKKIVVYFYSDAETEVSLEKGHLAEEVREIKENYFDYLNITKGSQPRVKLIIVLSDLIGVIEGIIKKIKI